MKRDTSHAAFSRRFNALLDKVGVPPKHKGRQGHLAKIFDVSDKAAWKWCNAKSIPRMIVLQQICDHYASANASVEWLLTGNDIYKPDWFMRSLTQTQTEPELEPVLEKYLQNPLEQDEKSDIKSEHVFNPKKITINKLIKKESQRMSAPMLAQCFNIKSPNQLMVLDRVINSHIDTNPLRLIDEAIEFLNLYREEVEACQESSGPSSREKT